MTGSTVPTRTDRRHLIDRLVPRMDANTFVPFVIILVLLFLVLVPLAQLILESFRVRTGRSTFDRSVDNYVDTAQTPETYTTLLTSLQFAFGSTALAMALGLSVAWVVERTDAYFRKTFRIMAIVPLLMPGLLVIVAWIFLLNPRIGWFNSLFNDLTGQQSPLNIYGLAGMIWVEGLRHSTLAFLLFSAALRSMDPSLEEAATMGGASTVSTTRRVTIPLLRPAIASIAILLFIQAIDGFEVAAFLGIPARVYVFTNEIYLSLRTIPPDQGRASTLSVIVIVLTAVMVLIYSRVTSRSDRFRTITGKAFRPRVMPLGRYRWLATGFVLLYLLLVLAAPLFILVWVSFLPFYEVPSFSQLSSFSLDNYRSILEFPQFSRAVTNSVTLALASGLVVMTVTAVIAWVVERTRLPGRRILDFITFVPIAIPGLVVGVALISMYSNSVIPIYGTLWILLLAYTTQYLPFGMRANVSSIVQIHSELEEAASVAGASWGVRFRRIILPLMFPGFLAGFIYVFILAIREFSASILLSNSDTRVLSILIFDLLDDGQSTVVAALAVLMILFTTTVVAIALKLTGFIGIRNI